MITSNTRPLDCLVEMLETLQEEPPCLFDVDERERWFDALSQLVRELPLCDQRMAWVVLIAQGLCTLVPGATLPTMAAYVQARLTLEQTP